MATAKPVSGLSGYIWFYQPAHGLRGRHAYNPSTGATLSERQVRNIRAGKATEQSALAASATPYKTKTIKAGKDTLFKQTSFRSLYGAWKYASSLGATTQSYLEVYGEPIVPYPNDIAGFGYRTLFGYANGSGHRARGIFAYYHRMNMFFESAHVGNPIATGTGPFFVFERLRDVSTYQG